MTRAAELVVDGRTVARLTLADTFLTRLRGMLGRTRLPDALLLIPGNSVHGIGMRVPLDVAVLDRDGWVLWTGVLRPWHATRTVRGGRKVLEAPIGSFERWGLAEGSQVLAG